MENHKHLFQKRTESELPATWRSLVAPMLGNQAGALPTKPAVVVQLTGQSYAVVNIRFLGFLARRGTRCLI